MFPGVVAPADISRRKGGDYGRVTFEDLEGAGSARQKDRFYRVLTD